MRRLLEAGLMGEHLDRNTKVVALLLAVLLLACNGVKAADNASHLRACRSAPNTELAVHATKMAGWLGCWRESQWVPGWVILVYDRGLVADSTGTTKVRLTSYSIREYVWTVLTPLGPIEGNGTLHDYDLSDGNQKASVGPGGIAVLTAPDGGKARSPIAAQVSLTYSVPEIEGTGRVTLEPIDLVYTPYQLDMGVGFDATNELYLETVWKPAARRRILAYNACWRHAQKPYTLQDQGHEDFGLTILAKLALIREDPTFKCEIDGIVGEQRTLLEQVEEALVQSRKDTLPGTSMDELAFKGYGCPRDGEFDTGLWAMVRVLVQYGDLLSEATRQSIYANVMAPFEGRYIGDPAYTSGGFCGMNVPETENHILLLESSRYLINDIKQRSLGAAPLPKYDNGVNGQRQWLLAQLQLVAQGGFYEFNAIPYQRYTYYALANLADLASDGDPIKSAASILIRYLDAKFVLSTIDLRRNAPLRRRRDAEVGASQTFYGIRDDVQAGRWAYFSGSSVSLDNASAPFGPHSDDNRDFRTMHWWQTGNPNIAVLTSQQPEPFLANFKWKRGEYSYFQAFVNKGPAVPSHFAFAKSGYEIYWNDRTYLIAAGGEQARHGYDSSQFPPRGGEAARLIPALLVELGVGPLGAVVALLAFDQLKTRFADRAANEQNVGFARPTVLLPEGTGMRRDDVLRFLGHPSIPRNSCVAPNFLCGTRPEVPQIFSTVESCARMRLRDANLHKFWRENLDSLGCPIFGSEASKGYDHWVSFANGAAVVRYNATNQVAYFVSAIVAYAGGAYINLKFAGPSRDFHIVRYRVPGAPRDSQIDLGRSRGYQTTEIAHQIPAPKGNFSIQMSGCYFGNFNSGCPDGWLGPLAFEVRDSERIFPAPVVCSATIPEQGPASGNVAVVEFGTMVGGICRGSVLAGIYVSPCETQGPDPDSPQCGEAGGRYGFAETRASGGRIEERDAFAIDFARRVSNKVFRFGDQSQLLTTFDGSKIEFVFHPFVPDTWAIRSVTSTTPGAAAATGLSTNIWSWPLAVGQYMNYSTGVYTITSPHSSQTLKLDFSILDAPLITFQ